MERKAIRTFEDLLVWQKAIEFVKEVYLVTNEVIWSVILACATSCVARPFQSQLISPKGLSVLQERNIYCSWTSQKAQPARREAYFVSPWKLGTSISGLMISFAW